MSRFFMVHCVYNSALIHQQVTGQRRRR